MHRREFLDWLKVSTAATTIAATGAGCVASEAPPRPASEAGLPIVEAQRTLRIGMLVYPKFTAMDLIGPYTIFAQLSNAEVYLVWKTLDAVTSDAGITLSPTRTFATCPDPLDVLFVPGGTSGTVAMMEDAEVLAFLRSRATAMTWVTSVCTGSLVLGAAGLLRGSRATTHWVALDVLSALEATPVGERYVEHGNRMTGAGISAGIDFGLRMAERLRGAVEAQRIQLNLEYAPEPPYPGGGSPETAPSSIVTSLETRYVPFLAAANAAAEAAASNFP
jgi:cyclohexyl-isocyanide hydratase